ncbi:MAG: M28 family peptidase [Candidatus Eisenbacteria bacterium]|uniref:M28 family peptidase n=1 Tax=Eiseniibacteriota bacterium TaxID=2212470 RepID=A0A956SFA2_UNCEI|nr:M28 family peptidase [Candidatus Eisenbacteria bacterium]
MLRRLQLTGIAAVVLLAGRGMAAPEPVALDPVVVDLLTEVSQDSLFNAVQTLYEFQTRNTASDTLSTTTGVGAARRWVRERFEQYGAFGNYFDWDDDVCNVSQTFRNVLGTFPGSQPNRVIMVGGHLDSRTVDLCNTTASQPGANDDASGTACLLEVARLLPALDLETTVVLQAFTGEEQGLLGSTYYSAFARANDLDIEAMIANDIIGNIDGCPGVPDCGGGPTTDQDSLSIRAFSGDPATGASRQLARLTKMIGEGYVDEMTVRLQPAIDRPGRGSDHIPFYEDGFPSIRLMETLEYTLQQHNANDTIGNMEFSYFRRNVLINLAIIANLAQAPESPDTPQVWDLGTGGGIRVEWPNVAGDVAGYRIAYRYVDQGDTLYWADVVDAGAATTFDVLGLVDDVSLAVSVSAYDADGHESLFTEEQLVTPGTVPHAPSGFSAVSLPDWVELTWPPAQELDLDYFRVFRSLSPDVGFVAIDSVGASTTEYQDASALPGIDYYYRISSVDLDGLESPETQSEKGRLQELAPGLLVVDGTRNGAGGIGNPNDADVDAYYATLLSGAPVLAHWDWTTQFDNSGIPLTDADMGRYETVFFHCDLRNNGSIDQVTTELREYVENGGQLFLCGWGLKGNLTDATGDLTDFGPGDFFYDVLKVQSVRTTPNSESDFEGADPLDSSYLAIDVDTGKWPFLGGNLNFMDAFLGGLVDGAAPLLGYRSSSAPPGPNDGYPVGLKWPVVSPRVIVFDVPLYFIQTADAQSVVDQALREFGYGASAGAPVVPVESALLFSARPNPAQGETEFSFYLRQETTVSLELFDVQGRAVRVLQRPDVLESGRHAIEWNGRDDRGRRLPSGMYYATLRVGSEWQTREVTLLP